MPSFEVRSAASEVRRLACTHLRVEIGHSLELHVSMLKLPFVVGLKQDGSDEADELSSFGKMPTTSARRLTSLLSRSSGLFECNLVRCCAGKARASFSEGRNVKAAALQRRSDGRRHIAPIQYCQGGALLFRRQGQQSLLAMTRSFNIEALNCIAAIWEEPRITGRRMFPRRWRLPHNKCAPLACTGGGVLC